MVTCAQLAGVAAVRRYLSMRRYVPLCALAVLAACKDLSVPVVTIPEGSLVYRIEPSILVYDFVNITSTADLHLSWITDPPPPVVALAGWNCIALLPLSVTDTIGTFVFAAVGPNLGRLQRTTLGVTDTINGLLLVGTEGTRGSFALTSAGTLKLFWSDGQQTRFFDPAATLRLANDTIFADADLRERADSTRVEWQVRWVRALDCKA